MIGSWDDYYWFIIRLLQFFMIVLILDWDYIVSFFCILNCAWPSTIFLSKLYKYNLQCKLNNHA